MNSSNPFSYYCIVVIIGFPTTLHNVGIVHAERSGANGARGLQLWVNLAKKYKMAEPKYQELKDKDIPRITKDGVTVKVIAGEAFGITSPVYTYTPVYYLDFIMEPNSQFVQVFIHTSPIYILFTNGELL